MELYEIWDTISLNPTGSIDQNEENDEWITSVPDWKSLDDRFVKNSSVCISKVKIRFNMINKIIFELFHNEILVSHWYHVNNVKT